MADAWRHAGCDDVTGHEPHRARALGFVDCRFIRQGKEVVGTMSVAAPLIGLSDERVADSAAPGEGKRAIWISPCNRHNRPKVSDVTGKLNKDRAAMPPNNCLT